jgi:hypothetical protein
MSIRNVPAARGFEWIARAIQLILKNPVPFLLMGLVVGVIYVIPILGSLVIGILGPAASRISSICSRPSRRTTGW